MDEQYFFEPPVCAKCNSYIYFDTPDDIVERLGLTYHWACYSEIAGDVIEEVSNEDGSI